MDRQMGKIDGQDRQMRYVEGISTTDGNDGQMNEKDGWIDR